jgi:hypothetical protein
MAYTNTVEVGNYLGTTFDDTTTPTDVVVDGWILESDSYIDSYIGYTYGTSVNSTVYIPCGTPTDIITLETKYKPLYGIIDLYRNDGTDFNPVYTKLVEGTDFIIHDLETATIKFLTPIKGGLSRALKIDTLITGYGEVPELVQDVSTRLTAKKVIAHKVATTSLTSNERINVGPIGISNDSGGSITFIKQLNNEINDMLSKLKGLETYTY